MERNQQFSSCHNGNGQRGHSDEQFTIEHRGRPGTTPALLARSPHLSTYAKAAWVVLDTWSNPHPSLTTLAQLIPCSYPTAVKALSELEKAGWLKRVQRNRRKGETIRYILNHDGPIHQTHSTQKKVSSSIRSSKARNNQVNDINLIPLTKSRLHEVKDKSLGKDKFKKTPQVEKVYDVPPVDDVLEGPGGKKTCSLRTDITLLLEAISKIGRIHIKNRSLRRRYERVFFDLLEAGYSRGEICSFAQLLQSSDPEWLRWPERLAGIDLAPPEEAEEGHFALQMPKKRRSWDFDVREDCEDFLSVAREIVEDGGGKCPICGKLIKPCLLKDDAAIALDDPDRLCLCILAAFDHRLPEEDRYQGEEDKLERECEEIERKRSMPTMLPIYELMPSWDDRSQWEEKQRLEVKALRAKLLGEIQSMQLARMLGHSPDCACEDCEQNRIRIAQAKERYLRKREEGYRGQEEQRLIQAGAKPL